MSRVPTPEALPQGPAARFAEEVVDVAGDRIVCRGRVPTGCPAVENGTAPTWLAIELAAQAAALLQATAHDEGDRLGAGYLVRLQRARFARPTVEAGETLRASVIRRGGAGPLVLFEAVVEAAGDEIAKLSFAVYAPSSPD